MKDSSDLTPQSVEAALGIHLSRPSTNFSYQSPRLAEGWTLSLLMFSADASKRGFVLSFDNKDASAPSAPACLLDLAEARSVWQRAGFRESEDYHHGIRFKQ